MKKVKSIKFNPLLDISDCKIRDMHTGMLYFGRMVEMRAKKIFLFAGHTLPSRAHLLVQFLDPVSMELVTLYIKKSPFFEPFNLANYLLKRRMHRFLRKKITRIGHQKPRMHQFTIGLRKDIPSAYKKLYERSVSDAYVSKLSFEKRSFLSRLGRLFIKEKIRYKIAQSTREKEAAYRLIYREYLHRGFVRPDPHEMYSSIYLLHPKTTTIVGKTHEDVLLTISAIFDSELKLPSDRLFGDVFDRLRAEGRKLTEFTMLATKHRAFGKKAYSLFHYNKMAALFSLFRLIVTYARRVEGVTDVVMTINPKYQKLYKYLCFEQIGDLRHYTQFNNQPALAFRLDLTKVTDPSYMKGVERLVLMNFFFKQNAPDEILKANHELSSQDIDYLFRKKSDLLKKLSPDDIRLLSRSKPELPEIINT